MIELYAAVVIALIGVGFMAAILFLFAIGIHREDRAHSLGQTDPGRITGGLRSITQAYAHPRLPELASRHRQRDKANDLVILGRGSATTRVRVL
jgi:hypothetical protein